MSTVPRILTATVLCCVACSDAESAPPPTTSAAPSSVDAVTDPSCSSQSVSVRREEAPTGSCQTGAQCRFSTPGGLELCAANPELQYASSSGAEWSCECPDGEWKCETTGGGFGLIPCPGAGADAGL